MVSIHPGVTERTGTENLASGRATALFPARNGMRYLTMGKYHNKVITTGDGKFDSKRELNRWEDLKLLERAGIICDLKRQVHFELIPKQELPVPIQRKGSKYASNYERPVEYVADFTYYENGKLVVEDSKGQRTPEYVIKRKLMLYNHGIQILET